MKNTHITDVQKDVLCAYMADHNLFANCQHLVSSKIFTQTLYQDIYKIIKSLHERGTTPDIKIIYEAVRKSHPKDQYTSVLSWLSPKYLLSNQVIDYVCMLFNEYARQYLVPKIGRVYTELESEACDISNMIKSLKEATNNVELALNGVSKDRSIQDQFDEAMKKIEGVKTGDVDPAFSWGINSIDERTVGIFQGMNVVAADKGGGKTSALINIMRKNAIEMNLPLLFFSLEMTAADILINIAANVKRINSRSLRTGQIDDNELNQVKSLRNRLNTNFTIDETGGITWEYFEAKVKAFRQKNKIPLSTTILVLLDYLQLMKNSKEEMRMTKEERVEQTCNELTRICKNENIALVLLSQFSREGNKRGNDPYLKTPEDKLRALRPKMGDLKGSGAIESNAVQILLLFRPEYYGIVEANGRNWEGICEVNQVKGRFVKPEPVYVKFTGKYNLFEDWEDEGIKSGSESF